jgi:hypothetical protein
MLGALMLVLAMPAMGQTDAERSDAEQAGAGHAARLVTVARKKKHSKGKAAKSAPAVSREQMELAQQMVRNAYALGRGLEAKQRVALMLRLLYTMRPEVMSAEKKQWAEELFWLAQQLPQTEATEVDSARNAAIATAAARVAVYDADRALELLDSLPPQNGRQADARAMAARLVFAGYMQLHGAPGAQTLLSHGRRWSEHGGFPYGASAAALGKLRPNDQAAEDFFRQVLLIFERGQERLYGVSDFASLLEQAVAMEAISEESAEEAGGSVVGQLRKLVENHDTESRDVALTPEQERMAVEALGNVRISAPKAYENAQKNLPSLFALRATRVAVRVEIPKVDTGLQSAFRELEEAMRARRSPDEMHEVIARGLQLVNAKYKAGACAACASPDAQSWALVSLAALATPTTIATQLTGIENPFWHAYFLAIASQQVGQPTRVADPTARKVAGKEEAEPE